METEDKLSARYEAELAAIAAIDRRYYLNPCPSRAEHSDYAARQDRLEESRSRLYAELASLRQIRRFRRCRFFIQRPSPNQLNCIANASEASPHRPSTMHPRSQARQLLHDTLAQAFS